MDFTIKDILELLIKRSAIIISCTILGLLFTFTVNKYMIRPTYTASVQMYINPHDNSQAADLNDLNYAQKVINTYINFLKTNVFYKQVLEQSKLEYSIGELKNITNIWAVSNTEIFQISVSTHNRFDSYNLVNTMQEIAPKLIKSIKDTAEISVVDPAVLPVSPSGPNIVKNTLIGGMICFVLSIFGIFMLETLDNNIKSQEQLTSKFQLPVLGAIPTVSGSTSNNNHRSKNPIIKHLLKKQKMTKENQNDTKFIVSEAYKSFRANLRFFLRSEGCKTFMISSPNPEDGKSTISSNIAMAIAQTKARVLIIDCDMRMGRLHNFFNTKSFPGLSDVLSGIIDEKQAIRNTVNTNLKLMTMGEIPPNPTELLSSIQMEDLINKLKKEYDYIIIDTPPVNVVSDALSMIKLVDGVILVVKVGATSLSSIGGAISRFKYTEAKLLGFVINKVPISQNIKMKYNNYQKKSKNG